MCARIAATHATSPRGEPQATSPPDRPARRRAGSFFTPDMGAHARSSPPRTPADTPTISLDFPVPTVCWQGKSCAWFGGSARIRDRAPAPGGGQTIAAPGYPQPAQHLLRLTRRKACVNRGFRHTRGRTFIICAVSGTFSSPEASHEDGHRPAAMRGTQKPWARPPMHTRDPHDTTVMAGPLNPQRTLQRAGLHAASTCWIGADPAAAGLMVC